MSGIETADSFNFNPHKWLLVNFDCSVTWFRGPFAGASVVGNAMLDGERNFGGDQDHARGDEKSKLWNIPDYRHWQIPFGRR